MGAVLRPVAFATRVLRWHRHACSKLGVLLFCPAPNKPERLMRADGPEGCVVGTCVWHCAAVERTVWRCEHGWKGGRGGLVEALGTGGMGILRGRPAAKAPSQATRVGQG